MQDIVQAFRGSWLAPRKKEGGNWILNCIAT